MKKLVMMGGSGHCKSVLDAIKMLSIYDDIVITDRYIPAGSEMSGCRIVGNDDVLNELFVDGYKDAVISVGSLKDTSSRRNIHLNAQRIGFCFPSIIDISAVIAEGVGISEGVFTGKKSVINSGSTIDRFSIINTGAIVEHDCHIGEFSHISVGSVICGNCNIGNDVFVGANATIIQGVRVGMNCVIGAGSVVLADVPDNTTVMGIWNGKEFKHERL